MNEYDILRNCFPNDYYVFAQNYDSAFLFYHVTQSAWKPKQIRHRIVFKVSGDIRFEKKLADIDILQANLDLDRCYSISRVPMNNGKELDYFCPLHMSKHYGNSDALRRTDCHAQVRICRKNMKSATMCLCGGDFNQSDLKRLLMVMRQNMNRGRIHFRREALPSISHFILML